MLRFGDTARGTSNAASGSQRCSPMMTPMAWSITDRWTDRPTARTRLHTVTIRAPSVTDPRRAGLVRPGWNHRRPDHSGVRPADPTRNRQLVLCCPPQAKESELHLLPPPRTRPRAVDVLTGLPPVAASDQHLWDALTRARVNGRRRPDGRGFAASACAAIGSQLRRLPTLPTDQGRYHPSGRQHPHRRQRSAADREFTDALIVQDGGRPCVVNSCEGSHLPSCRPSGLGQAKPSGLGQAKR